LISNQNINPEKNVEQDYVLAKIGLDTAENELSDVSQSNGGPKMAVPGGMSHAYHRRNSHCGAHERSSIIILRQEQHGQNDGSRFLTTVAVGGTKMDSLVSVLPRMALTLYTTGDRKHLFLPQT
jgi:hypothetical protein